MFDRCRRCLGMGYKGAKQRGKWKLPTCRRCRGTGVDPKPATLPENKEPRRTR
jgi:DnaJ-class molecular chaperone